MRQLTDLKPIYPDEMLIVDNPPIVNDENRAAIDKSKRSIRNKEQPNFLSLAMVDQVEIPNLGYDDAEIYEQMGPVDYIGQHFNNPDFNIGTTLDRLEGPAIEIAGPSPSGFPLFDRQTDAKLEAFTSNITDGLVSRFGDEEYKVATVDFRADARKLPVKDASLAIVFSSCMPDFDNLRNDAFEEISRSLVEDGLVVWIGFPEDIATAEQSGLVAQEVYLENYILHDAKDHPEDRVQQRVHVIFQKKS